MSHYPAGQFATCESCGQRKSVKRDGKFRQHKTDGELCPGSDTEARYKVPDFDWSTPGDLTAADIARRFRCSSRKVRDEATRHSIGYNLGGRAGWRFTPADVDKLRRAMAPAPVVEPRRTA